jgi:hypothetical protein
MTKLLILTNSSNIRELENSGEFYVSYNETNTYQGETPCEYHFIDLLKNNPTITSIVDKVFMIVNPCSLNDNPDLKCNYLSDGAINNICINKRKCNGIAINIKNVEVIVAMSEAADHVLQSIYPNIIFKVIPSKILYKYLDYIMLNETTLGAAISLCIFNFSRLPEKINENSLKKLITNIPQGIIIGLTLRSKNKCHYDTKLIERTIFSLITSYKRLNNYPNNNFGYCFDMLEIFFYAKNRQIEHPIKLYDYEEYKVMYDILMDMSEKNPNFTLNEIIEQLKKMDEFTAFLDIIQKTSNQSVSTTFFFLKIITENERICLSIENIKLYLTELKSLKEKIDLVAMFGAYKGYHALKDNLYQMSDVKIFKPINDVKVYNQETQTTNTSITQAETHNLDAYKDVVCSKKQINNTIEFISNILNIPEHYITKDIKCKTFSLEENKQPEKMFLNTNFVPHNFNQQNFVAANDITADNILLADIDNEFGLDPIFNNGLTENILQSIVENNKTTNNINAQFLLVEKDFDEKQTSSNNTASSNSNISSFTKTNNKAESNQEHNNVNEYNNLNDNSKIDANIEVNTKHISAIENERRCNSTLNIIVPIAKNQEKTSNYVLASVEAFKQALQICKSFAEISKEDIRSTIINIIKSEAPIKKDLIYKRINLLCHRLNIRLKKEDKKKIKEELEYSIVKLNCITDEEDFIYIYNKPVYARNRRAKMYLTTAKLLRNAHNICKPELIASINIFKENGTIFGDIPDPMEIIDLLGLTKVNTSPISKQNIERIETIIKSIYLEDTAV